MDAAPAKEGIAGEGWVLGDGWFDTGLRRTPARLTTNGAGECGGSSARAAWRTGDTLRLDRWLLLGPRLRGDFGGLKTAKRLGAGFEG